MAVYAESLVRAEDAAGAEVFFLSDTYAALDSSSEELKMLCYKAASNTTTESGQFQVLTSRYPAAMGTLNGKGTCMRKPLPPPWLTRIGGSLAACGRKPENFGTARGMNPLGVSPPNFLS
jgi:hypothetical protein